MAIILDGKKIRDEKAIELKKKVSSFLFKPKLVIIQIGDDKRSCTYIKQKKMFGEKIGCIVEHLKFEANINEKNLIKNIKKLNVDNKVHGIIVQMPIPSHLNKLNIIEAINFKKDVDGLTAINTKLLWENQKEGLVPATAKGIISLLDYYKIPIEGKRVVVVGRSSLVGKPAVLMFLNRGATVFICHSQTANLSQETKNADILVVAVGKAGLITKKYVSSGQVVVDVGINLRKGGRLNEKVLKTELVGDVNFEEVKNIVKAISPVPGGVGPMTVLSLFENLINVYEKTNK